MRWTQKEDFKEQWRKWFAWRPIQLTGTKQRVWLEWVERKREWEPGWGHDSFNYKYR